MNEDKHSIRWRTPPNLGWLEVDLSKNEIDHLWKCVDQSMKNDPQCFKSDLAGNISHSYKINDLDDYFFNNTITPLIKIYKDFFRDMIGDGGMPILRGALKHFEPKLERLWVNYQKQHDFNPPHHHSGLYSFVIWLKIPIDFNDQNKDNITNNHLRSAFSIKYIDLLGKMCSYNYELDKSYEGKMLFFPAELNHEVFPFYDCEEDRISIS